MASYKDKLKKSTNNFWDVLFRLLDQDKSLPLYGDQDISAQLDGMYDLVITRDWAILRKRESGQQKAKVKRHPKSNVAFPYISLLSWYLKEVA